MNIRYGCYQGNGNVLVCASCDKKSTCTEQGKHLFNLENGKELCEICKAPMCYFMADFNSAHKLSVCKTCAYELHKVICRLRGVEE